jgi:hypothetical protein
LSSAIGEKFVNSFQEISLTPEILGIKKRLMTELFYYRIISRYFPKIKCTPSVAWMLSTGHIYI